MSRMRSIKPEFWSDQQLTRLSRDVRMLYVALWNFADEQARMPGDSRIVKSWCFPLDDDVTPAVIDGWLDTLGGFGKVVRYEVDGSAYLHLPRLGEHQRLDSRLESRHPAPPAETQDSADRPEPQRKSAQIDPDSDASPPRAERAKHVAGGREHVAGNVRDPRTPPRLDVEQLCSLLADRMVANGCQRPSVTERWRESARLLLDRDKVPLADALRVLDWSQKSDFWKSNILSLPKFRERFDQLRLQSATPPKSEAVGWTGEPGTWE